MSIPFTRAQFTRALAAAALTLALGGTAMAAGPGYCNQYASAAVIAAGQNLAHHCGYYGPRWAADYNVHYGWCLGAAIPSAAREWRARRLEIAACFNRPY